MRFANACSPWQRHALFLASCLLSACAAGTVVDINDFGGDGAAQDVGQGDAAESGGPGSDAAGADAGKHPKGDSASDDARDIAPEAPDVCIIDAMSYPSGTANPANPCQSCQPAMSATAWSAVADETACTTGSCCSGTCVAETTDPTNCGKCGMTCPTVTNGTADCVTSTCGIVCNPGYELSAGACVVATTCPVTFPSTTSAMGGPGAPATLGSGGGGVVYQSGDYVEQTFTCPNSSATQLTVDFQMSDDTTTYCLVGTLSWNVLVNGVTVGSYSWVGGSGPTTHTISETYTFAAIAASAGSFTIEYIATSTVCTGGSSWNWIAGGSATLQ